MVIRMRHTRSHTRNRRSHHALKGARLSADKKTGTVRPRHKALLDGTLYRGRSVLDTTSNQKTKQQKKDVENQEKITEKQTTEFIAPEKEVLAESKKPTEKKIKK